MCWLTPGLGGEKVGQVSSRKYHRSRLRGTHHKGQTNVHADQPDDQVRYVHIPAATVQNILPLGIERSPSSLSNLFLLGVPGDSPDGQGQWTVQVPAIDKKLVVSTAWLRRFGAVWKAHGKPKSQQSYHEDEDTDSDDEDLSTKHYRTQRRRKANKRGQQKQWRPQPQMIQESSSDDADEAVLARHRKTTVPMSDTAAKILGVSQLLNLPSDSNKKNTKRRRTQPTKALRAKQAKTRVEDPCVVKFERTDVTCAVDHILAQRQAWAWKSNSCHLDSMLLIELAGYYMAPRRLGVPVTTCIKQLQSVLALVTTTARDKYRDMWQWYLDKHGNGELKHGVACDLIYHWVCLHKHLPQAQHKNTVAQTRNVEADRCVVVYFNRTGCTEHCTKSTTDAKLFGCLTLTYNWERKVDGVIQQVRNATVEEAVERKLYQVSAGPTCTECGRPTQDEPVIVKMPTQLTLTIEDRRQERGDRWRWPEKMKIHMNEYNLVGLAIRVLPSHYIARVKLNGSWYEYDDLHSGQLKECGGTCAHDEQTSNRYIRAAVYIRSPGIMYSSVKTFEEIDHTGVADVY